ncbi:hypothetical protein GKE82_23515 [Conexibacter sp. W3-3-2]|uniref:hypothetical protein n=1 Tax=Conexibacter sp. W3-3-2 TaxID=2675227 RepID=UPI0012B7495C|nr:hypothetical protein [Conexibacter sp. W3-3-2]MTD47174.1 hypothetical protein [Conexibacter sp. W3-3-2]
MPAYTVRLIAEGVGTKPHETTITAANASGAIAQARLEHPTHTGLVQAVNVRNANDRLVTR